MKQFYIFGLIKPPGLSPEKIAEMLCTTIFKDYKTQYSKGIISVDFDNRK